MSKLSDFAESGEYRMLSTTFEQTVERCLVRDSEFTLSIGAGGEQLNELLLNDQGPNQIIQLSVGDKKVVLSGAVCTDVTEQEDGEYLVVIRGIVLNEKDFRLVARERDIELEEKLVSGGVLEMFPTGFYTEWSRYSLKNDKEYNLR